MMQESFITEAQGRASLQNSGILWEIGTSLVAQTVNTLPTTRRPGFNPWVRKIPWRRKRQPTPVFSENSMDRRAWQATDHTVHGVTKSPTGLSD